MRKNLYKFAALTMFAALSITACKKHEAVDISGIHTSAAETMAETTSNETKADPAADNSKSDSSKTDASKAGSSEVETQKDSNASSCPTRSRPKRPERSPSNTRSSPISVMHP